MTALAVAATFFALLLLSATFSGSETGLYSMSRVRLDADARQGRWTARLLRRLLRNDTGLLITLLIGNNLMLEIATHLAEDRLDAWTATPSWATEIFVATLLTPVVFVTGELLPKDLFRRWPHRLLAAAAPVIALTRVAFFPLALPLQALGRGLEHLLGVRDRDLARALRRDEVVDIFRQSSMDGALAPHAAELARNVLDLRGTRVGNVMIPWNRVETADLSLPDPELRAHLSDSDFSRLPALRPEAGSTVVAGYLVQLDVLRSGEAEPVASLVRSIVTLPPELAADRALARMSLGGHRVALVGSATEPLGLVSVMDLVAAIAGAPGGSRA